MSGTQKRYSPSVEDYLKAVYSLSREGEPASTSALADALGVQPSSVTGMIKRLASESLLEHVPYRGVRLTDAGHREALRVLRRHRILETYLTERLEYSWDDVHDEAERLEHAASDRLIEAMASALDDPSHDPHGAPIPTATGEIEATDSTTLADVQSGEVIVIRAVRDEDAARLRLMKASGLLPGVRVEVVGRQTAGGSLTLRVDQDAETLVVGHEVARRIFIARPQGT